MSALFSSSVRVLFLCALLATGVGWSAERAHAQAPLGPVTGLEVVGELRPGTPNIPLLLVVQWNLASEAESYELERAEPAPTAQERVFVAVATITPQFRAPGVKVRYVDEAGFATAGGDCFRVRAVSGAEVSDWAEVCLPVPPSSGGPPPAQPGFNFHAELTSDYEFTVITWEPQIGFYGPFDVTEQDGPSPLATFREIGGAAPLELVLPRYAGCFRLKTPGVAPVSPPCALAPTDLQPPALLDLVEGVRGVTVLETGRAEAPLVVAWPAQGGPEAVFRVDRITTFGEFEIVTLARRATLFQGWRSDVQVFLDPEPNGEQQCYRVTQTSYVGESVIGEACLADTPGPPDLGTGLEGSNGGDRVGWTYLGVVLLVIAGSLRRRTAR
ncbi:MAG: hypothetical protein ACRDHF_08085 [Tepidiformaceae bacterium]